MHAQKPRFLLASERLLFAARFAYIALAMNRYPRLLLLACHTSLLSSCVCIVMIEDTGC